MRAALYESTGPARDVLSVREVAIPEPGAGQVRVRVEVSGINPTDVKSRAGVAPRPFDGFQIPHHDAAGVIDAVGEGVDPARVGQRVWLYMAAATRSWGTAAEWTVLAEHQAVPLPDAAAAGLGVCLGVPAMTAHHCLFSDGPLTGRTVLVAGGAGAVGHYAVELAAWSGATVVATASGPEKAESARRAGAAHVVNYRDPDAAAQIRRAVSEVDRVIEVDLGANLGLDLAVLRQGGTVVSYATGAKDATLPMRACMTANVALRFMLLYTVAPEAVRTAAEGVALAVADGALTALPLHHYPLDRVAEAHEAVEAGVTGKVVIDL
ncbi:MAG TPA: NADPH:quinone reductase [Pseudonocardia sp.]|jgi:NADPH2:quinone reductase